MKKELNPEESVRDEQFGADDKAAESSEQMSKNTSNLDDAGNSEEMETPAQVSNDTVTEETEAAEVVSPDAATEKAEAAEVVSTDADSEETEATAMVSTDADSEETEATSMVSPDDSSEAETPDKESVKDLSKEVQTENASTTGTDITEPDTIKEASLDDNYDTADEVSDDEQEESETDEDADEAGAGEAVGDVVPNNLPEEDRYKDIDLPAVDYSGFSKNDLVETLGLILENRPVAEIRDDVERIRIYFYKKHKAEAEEQKTKFLEGGGKIEDFKPEHDNLEDRLKDYLEKYRVKRSDQSRVQEAEKNENLRKKYDIIDKIKDLVNREESINKTFQEFRSLQNEWHSIGVVPQSALKDLWENYHHNVEIFYDYIKINKELRDLDLKKNLELKIALCEKAEELLLEPNAVNAFRILQEFHNQWREIGPVPHESKNEVWERFKEATSKINKRHHEYFESQKDEQRKNLEAKIAICEKVEEINLQEFKLFRDFDEKSEEIVKLQKLWRTIGFAPKKHNNRIYQRFREACDTFFEKKRSFYSENKEVQQDNLQKKTELCIQAESFMESTDWKSTTDALIKLQREWKEVGPVPRKQSEKIWKRFRKACDHFFARKAEHFATVDTSYEDNLAAKMKIIEELENFDESLDLKVAFEKLKDIQRRWAEIGFVPFNAKEEVNQNYRNALNKQFDRLKINDEDKNILKYRNKLDSVKSNPKLARKVRTEREKFYTRIRQLENDITLWENNIGFFAKSKAAESMISEVEEKIENAKKTIRILEEKVKMIDLTGLDE